MMNDVTFAILKIVVSICAALVTVYLIPYIKTLREDKRYAQALDIVQTAVRAAEQTCKDDTGEFKKSEVLSFVCQWLEKNGVKMEMSQLDRLIECAVYQMKNNG